MSGVADVTTGLFGYVGPLPFFLGTALTTMGAAVAAIGITTLTVFLWSSVHPGR